MQSGAARGGVADDWRRKGAAALLAAVRLGRMGKAFSGHIYPMLMEEEATIIGRIR